ncbi:MAG: D-alanyl-D-alanine carboxypeptidase family protein [Armatimonadota bacterium]|nr:D-alanyl-D-alanine carboxypeptidase family protein [Armatimonadota bacterium]
MRNTSTITAIALFLALLSSTCLAKQELNIELPDWREPQQPVVRAAPQTLVKAPSAILVDAESGQILFSKNIHTRRPMASTTKIMTAILVLENCGMNTMVAASKNACGTPTSSLHMVPGEQLTIKNLLYGMLIRSANDACVAVGEHIAGSNAKFIKMMNERANRLGANDTHFVNPHGLDAQGHYSSAYDLSLMARHAVKFPLFNEIVNTRKAAIQRSKNQEDVVIFNHSKFLKRYADGDGIKSGYTKQAGKCYIGSATRNGWRLISVVLNSPDVAEDTIALMEYGFKNFEAVKLASRDKTVGTVRVKGGSRRTVQIAPGADLRAIVNADDPQDVTTKMETKTVSAPIKDGQRLGYLVAYIDGVRVAATSLRATQPVGRGIWGLLIPWMRNGFILLIGLMVSKRYGATAAKGAGYCRNWVSQEVRRTHRRR